MTGRDPLDFSQLPDVTALHPELSDEERWYAAHMKAREDAFEHVFGACEPEGTILTPTDPQLTEEWPAGGIYMYPPRDGRRGWHYVTHGLAQPLDQEEIDQWKDEPKAYSGFGIELVISATEPNDWAPGVLLDLVQYLLFDEDAQLIWAGDRIPYRGLPAVEGAPSLAFLLATLSPEYSSELLLPAGHCTLVHLVGVTREEIERVTSAPEGVSGGALLTDLLFELGDGLVTTPGRACLTEGEGFEERWGRSVSAKLLN